MLESRLAVRLREIDDAGLKRTLRPPTGIDLCSNDYLGLATHPLLKQRMAEAVLAHGCGSTGSRLLRGERASFSAIEARFAAYKDEERSLYFSSGYLANLAVLTTFPEEGDTIFSDERNHASLIDGVRLSRARRVIFPHNDVDALARLLDQATGGKFVVVESLFSMDGDYAPLPAYADLCRETGATLIVDEAHSVGIHAGVPGLSVNPAGKALGVSGAFVAGSAIAIEYLIQRARPFIFSTAAPPSVAAALDAALDVIETEPERQVTLWQRARYLRSRLGLGGESHIVPIMIGDNEKALATALALQEQGFDVRAIRPPTVPAGTARLRVSVNAGLTEANLDSFVEALHSCIPKCSAASL